MRSSCSSSSRIGWERRSHETIHIQSASRDSKSVTPRKKSVAPINIGRRILEYACWVSKVAVGHAKKVRHPSAPNDQRSMPPPIVMENTPKIVSGTLKISRKSSRIEAVHRKDHKKHTSARTEIRFANHQNQRFKLGVTMRMRMAHVSAITAARRARRYGYVEIRFVMFYI